VVVHVQHGHIGALPQLVLGLLQVALKDCRQLGVVFAAPRLAAADQHLAL
jgi:hypothetical protein